MEKIIPKIVYDKESKVLCIEMQPSKKSVDSDIFDNIVIDYDKCGKVVRLNLYDFSIDAFMEGEDEIEKFRNDFDIRAKMANKEMVG